MASTAVATRAPARTAARQTRATRHTGKSSTRTGRGRGRRCDRPMIDDLALIPIPTAAKLARGTWDEMGLYPGDLEGIWPTLTAIEDWADANGDPDLRDIDAAKMLRDIVGVNTLTGALKPKKREQLHLTRNVLTALRGTVLYHAAPGRRRSDRPAKDSLDAGLPTLAPRPGVIRRPLADDETLLANVLVEIDLLEGAPVQPVIAYLLGAAGVHTMESSNTTTDDLDHRTEPTSITAKGLWTWESRTVPFDEHTRNALARALTKLAPGTQRLTYTGATPGTKEASASLSPVITRFLRRAGVADRNITGKSLSITRAYRILRQHNDFKTAKKIHGGRAANLLVDIKCEIDETLLHSGKVRIVDRNTGKTIAKVKAGHVKELPKSR